ncbi:MAG TPA: TerC family protein [Frankiaceae bacterium]|nr:TerC family protein [Frankiaceae bacterium]
MDLGGTPLWAWGAVTVAILVMLLIDLLVVHKDAHAVTIREAAYSSAVWITIGLLFGLIIWATEGGQLAGEYYTGYLVEKSLSVDNIFVFALLFTYFAVPAALQHRVLFWGVVGALVFRAIFIALGATLLERFHWMIFVFGGFLVITGIRMAMSREDHVDPGRNPILRLMRKMVPMTDAYHGQKFTIREGGKRLATPLLAVLVAVETTDIIFAVDSIPAVFAVTEDPFLVFTSNAFAILGLRALYFLLADLMDRFTYLKLGLAVVLVFVGVKMLVSEQWHPPGWLPLVVIASILGISVWASLRSTRPGELEELADDRPMDDSDNVPAPPR